MVHQVTDARNHTTTYDYDTEGFNYYGSRATKITDALTHVTRDNYDFYTGLLTSATDPNGQVTTFAYDPGTLRPTLTTYPGGGWTNLCLNDSDGNNAADAVYSYTYDAENHIITASGMSGGPYCYTYDADGMRVQKAHGSSCATVDMLYWRNIAGNTIAETDSAGSTSNSSYHEYVFFAGRRVARSDVSSGSVYYYFVDHLGSTRSMTNAAGSACFKADYLPYGAENTPSGFTDSCNTSYKFTGYERDGETGNDYAFARYYNQRLGRFMSGDPLAGDTGDPQSLNRYAYVRNNPINRIDPTGLTCYDANGEPDAAFSDPSECESGSGGGTWDDDAWFQPIAPAWLNSSQGTVGSLLSAAVNIFGSAVTDSPFTFDFSGDLYGSYYVGSFDTWGGYASWATGLNALPQNQPGYQAAFNNQLNATAAALENHSGVTQAQIQAFLDSNAAPNLLEGGNFDFANSYVSGALAGQPIFNLGCTHNRCNDGLDFSHGDGTFHLDTANPYSGLGGAVMHLGVDVIGGQFMYFIPRH
jgi:RHS repeat-associated protein